MNIAIVTAAGSGTRMNNHVPKQFLTVNDKPIVIYTLEALQRNENIDGIVVACLGGWERMLAAYVNECRIDKVRWVIEGGKTGQGSITACLEKLRSEVTSDDLIMIHDGNRPFVEDRVINDSIRVCEEFGNAVAAVPCNEAILKLDGQSEAFLTSSEMIDRDQVVRTQTPHTFHFAELDRAYAEISRTQSAAVAACTVMVTLGKQVFFSAGSELNFKITTQEDLKLFSLLVNAGVRGSA